MRRLESLNCLFADGEPIGKAGYQDLMARFSGITPVRHDLSWIDYSRYSNRQNTKMPMGGLAGTVSFSQSDMWLAPWLQAAELVHVGKGASMGLGKIVVVRSESLWTGQRLNSR
ncbi:MAG: CRISPR system precrRNA processing endoribonuclease RAMP protein Cas6 [Desulfatirhabdiaceae bacterium]